MTPATPPVERGLRRTVNGTVVSDKMESTIVVQVVRRVKHPLYGKQVRRFQKFYAHDEKNQAHVGDTVQIMETRPMSRLKRWRLIRVLSTSTKQD